MRVLAIEPFYGGSHRALLDGWIARSRHDWTLITYSPHHWKWRSRHAAISAAAELQSRTANGESWEVLFCTDMVNLAELRGLCPTLAATPSVAYFHENQLTYPVRDERERDRHFAVSNFASALAADRVWFNSGFHLSDFLRALPDFWKQLPDHRPLAETASLAAKCEAQAPGVEDRLFDFPRGSQRPQPTLTWAARWEFDKNPESLFRALSDPRVAAEPWKLNVLGQRFPNSPDCFDAARQTLNSRIQIWGEASRQDYEETLAATDIYISTAIHEFFGIAAVEAIAAGAVPLLPERLAYPELLELKRHPELQVCFYERDEQLADALLRLLGAPLDRLRTQAREAIRRFAWSIRAEEMDERLAGLM